MSLAKLSALIAAIAMVCLGVGGPLGYACYLRSDGYRQHCATVLSERLGMFSTIARVDPLSWSSRGFSGIEVWLPERRATAATVGDAELAYRRDTQRPDDYQLTLLNGRCEISSRTWLREDVRFVVESGLGSGFRPGGPSRVFFQNFDVRLEREPFVALLRQMEGTIHFKSETLATLQAACKELNGVHVDEPIHLSAEVSPRGARLQIDELKLRVPELPLRVIGGEVLGGAAPRSGSFSGNLTYSESADARCVTLSGSCNAVELAEFTGGFLPRPFRGRCDAIRLEELTLQDGWPSRLRFAGGVESVFAADIAALLGLAPESGALKLDVRAAELSPDGVERFVASGLLADVDLGEWSRALGQGELRGRAKVELRELTVIDNRLVSLKARLDVQPDSTGGWISRRLLTSVAKSTLGISLPPILPERVEYSQMGAELSVEEETLYVLGTHGDRQRVLVTLRLPGGYELPAVKQPPGGIVLTPWLDQARARAREAIEKGAVEVLRRRDALREVERRAVVEEHAGEGAAP